jgi:hypothetical protein
MKLSRRFVAALITCSVAFLGAVAVSPAASAQPISSTRDSVTASGWDFATLRDSDVIAGSPESNVVVKFTAGRALTDGTLSVVLPQADWSTPLRPADGGLYDIPASDGEVAVRPAEDIGDRSIPPGAACSSPAATPLEWSVERAFGSQIIVVRHVSCAPGQQLNVRIKGIAAPPRVGVVFIPVIAFDAGGLPRVNVATLRVFPTPVITLHLDPIGPQVFAGTPFIIKVTATWPDGRVDTNYNGAVAVVSEDQNDCTTMPRDQSVAYQFTPADHGTAYITVTLEQPGVAHLLEVYDIGNTALPALSNRFDVVVGPDTPGQVFCSVSYD